MLDRILDSPRSLRFFVLMAATGALVLMVAALAARLAGSPGAPAAASAPAAVAPSSTALVPPTPQITDASTPEANYGDASPILLEALQAWLDGDARKFSMLATPEVVEAANAAPAPASGQEILSAPRLVEPGPTLASYRVNTTDGWMLVQMTVSRAKSPAGWVISDMEYVR